MNADGHTCLFCCCQTECDDGCTTVMQGSRMQLEHHRAALRLSGSDHRAHAFEVVHIEGAHSVAFPPRVLEKDFRRSVHDESCVPRSDESRTLVPRSWATLIRALPSPTLPGNTTYGVPGYRLSGPSCHTGTPGINCPLTRERFALSAFVTMSLAVIPPFATM